MLSTVPPKPARKETYEWMWTAAQNGNVSELKRHLEPVTQQNWYGSTVVVFEPASVNWAHPKHHSRTCLHVAVLNNRKEIVSHLLTRPDINVNAQDSYGMTALHYACYLGRVELAALLLQHGDTRTDVLTVKNNSALWFAVWGDQIKIVAMLMVSDKELAIDQPGTTPSKDMVDLQFAETLTVFEIARRKNESLLAMLDGFKKDPQEARRLLLEHDDTLHKVYPVSRQLDKDLNNYLLSASNRQMKTQTQGGWGVFNLISSLCMYETEQQQQQ